MRATSSFMLVNAGLSMAMLVLGSGFAQAARPLLTDDARVVEAGGCQIESWVQDAGGERQAWFLPACSGGVGTEWAVGAWDTLPRARSAHGAVAQAKRILRELEPGRWGVAATVGALVHDGAVRPYANLPISWLSGAEALTLHINLGRASGDGPASSFWTGGVAMEGRLAAHLWLIAEHHHPAPSSRLSQIGLRWWIVPDRLQLDATVGRTTVAQRSDAAASLGLRWLFEAPFKR